MAIESVASELDRLVISEPEMQNATDSRVPAEPGKFLPYRKLVSAIAIASDGFDERRDELMRLQTLIAVISERAENAPEQVPDLARIADDMARALIRHAGEASEGLNRIVESARATLPRKRWEDSGAPDDCADAEDLAREAAASVVQEDKA